LIFGSASHKKDSSASYIDQFLPVKFPLAHPAVIGSVTTQAGLRLLARAKLPADAVEIRVDALLKRGVTEEQIESALKARKHPVLLTLRIPAEGGHRPWKLAERRALYLRLLPHAEAIDVELATAVAMRPVLEAARDAGKTIVLSAHALKKAAAPAQFSRWLAQHRRDAHTILKIAGHIASWRDLQRLAALLVNYPERQVAVMGLGPHAPQSRSVLAALGSRLVYGWLDEPAAPGQPSAAEVKKMVEGLPGQS
jgi:3-dehydroquinate dehydratase-1